MLKKMSIRKITTTTLGILIVALFYFFPINNQENFNTEVILTNEKNSNIYLMTNNNYISKVMVNIEETKEIEIARKIINYLKEDNQSILNDNFVTLIPSDTRINNISLNEKALTIDLSKEFLNIEKKYEEKMLESLIYSLTEINGVNKIKLLIDGKVLEKLPNSKKYLPRLLDRSYGINKKYDITYLKALNSTVIYYINKIDDETYYTPVTLINNDSRDKISIIIDELKSSLIYQSNLSSYLSSSTELVDYKIVEDTMYLTFNENILDNLVLLEEVKYSIVASVKDNYDVEKVIFIVNNKEI